MKTRKSIKQRIGEILTVIDSLPRGERITQAYIMDAIKCSPGQWNEVKGWLDLIFKVQGTPIEREFVELKAVNGKGRIVTYYYKE